MTVPSTRDLPGVLDRFRESWEAADAAAFGRLFTEDATYVIYAGDVLRGRTQIEQAHRDLFAKGATRMYFTIVDTRYIGTDAAVVLTAGGIGSVEYDKFQTMVMTRANGDWMIAAFQNTAMSDRSKQDYGAASISRS